MPIIVGILIILAVIYHVVSTYPMTTAVVLVCIGLSILFYILLKQIAEAVKTRAAEIERLRELRESEQKERRDQQESYRSNLLSLCENSTSAFEEIPKNLLTAEELLDMAERDFRESAFSPFWETIGKAVKKLSDVRRSVKVIEESAKKYSDTIHLYERAFQAFPIDLASVSKLDVVVETEVRLREVVRQAQRNFQFAMIYEQHKTNDILVEGFQNLGDALFRLGEELSHSIAGLSDQMSDMASTLESGFDGLTTELSEIDRNIIGVSNSMMTLDADLKKISVDHMDRNDQVLVMLDNIQHRRLPLASHPRDHEY